ncbi:MAG: hydrogenase maturation protease [Thermoanaerobaculia bacterium]
MTAARTLIAGFGNVLRGDDGFGVVVIHRLREEEIESEEIEILEVGTAGLRLAQELLTPRDRLIVVDAMTRDGPPGSVYVLAVDAVEAAAAVDVDMHLAVPSRALALAKALGALPPRIFLVGCEPAEVDELTTELSPRVREAVDTAIRHIRELLLS